MYSLRKVEDEQKYYEFLYRGGVSSVIPHVVKILDNNTVKYSSTAEGIKYISNVPEGYAQIEYIESPGNTKTTAAYIQNLDKTYNIFEEMIEYDFMSYLDVQTYFYISNHFRLFLNKHQNSSGNWLQYISTQIRKPDSSAQHMPINLGHQDNYDNIRYKFTMYYNSSDGKIYSQVTDVINDITLLHNETLYDTSIPISDYNFSNDHILIGGNANNNYLNGRTYGFKIAPIQILNNAPVTNADEVYQYIPVIRLSDNTAGLIERISNGTKNRNTTRNYNWTFYPSTSSIPFIAGPFIKPNIGYMTMNSEDIGGGGGVIPSDPIVINP